MEPISLERIRLLKLLDRSKCSRVIFLTGDRHVGGIYKYGKYHEVTSSSLTHTVTYSSEPDSMRLFPLVHVNNVASVIFDWNRAKSHSVCIVLRVGKLEKILQTYNVTM